MKMTKSFSVDFWRAQNTRTFKGLPVLKFYLNIFVVSFNNTKQILDVISKQAKSASFQIL